MSREYITIHIELDAPELLITVRNRLFEATISNEPKPLEKLYSILYDFICTHVMAKAYSSDDVPLTERNNKPSPNELLHRTLQIHALKDRYALKRTLTMRRNNENHIKGSGS